MSYLVSEIYIRESVYNEISDRFYDELVLPVSMLADAYERAKVIPCKSTFSILNIFEKIKINSIKDAEKGWFRISEATATEPDKTTHLEPIKIQPYKDQIQT